MRGDFSNQESEGKIMGDKGGKKDKDKHNKQADMAKKARDEAIKARQQKTP